MTNVKRDDLEDTKALEPQLGTSAAGPIYEPHCYPCGELLEPYRGQDRGAPTTAKRYWCPRCRAVAFAVSYKRVDKPGGTP